MVTTFTDGICLFYGLMVSYVGVMCFGQIQAPTAFPTVAPTPPSQPDVLYLKISKSTYVFVHGCGATRNSGGSLSEASFWKKTNSFSPRSHQLSMFPQPGGGLQEPLPYPFWHLAWLDLVQIFCMTSWLPWVHMCNGRWVWQVQVFYRCPLLRYWIFVPSSAQIPEPWEDVVLYKCSA